MLNRFKFSFLMLASPNKYYIRTLFCKWIQIFLTSASFGCGWIGVVLSCVDTSNEFKWKIIISLFIVTILISFFWAIPNCYKSFKISGNGGSKIELVVGDILKDSDDMIIPSNTFFDTSRQIISSKSIQGQLVNRKYDGCLADLNDGIKVALENSKMEGKFVSEKVVGNQIRYPLNTILAVSKSSLSDSQRFYLLALCDFTNEGDIIKDKTNIHDSINSIWKYLQEHIHVRNLCIPVLGTGLTSKNIPQFDVMEVIIDSFLVEVTKLRFVDTLRIYLYPKGPETFTAFHLAGQYIQHRIENISAIELKPIF